MCASSRVPLAMALAMSLAPAAGMAKTVHWSSAGDIATLDIHSQNIPLANGIYSAIYESLVAYNSRTFKPEPQLAASWRDITPTQWRFTLRSGVKFSDGSPLTVDDVIFSINRAMAKTSRYTVYTQGIDKVVKVNESTFDFMLKAPNPVFLSQLTELRIMNRAWAEKNLSIEPKDIRPPDENFAHRNALGTGPFLVKEWQPDQRLVLVRNPHYWGRVQTNVTKIVYLPMKSEVARSAALLAGEIDLVLDPGPQELPRLRHAPGLKVVDGVENRTIFLGMDQFRDELPGSSVKGRNPLKDPRVRKALYQAIDSDHLHRVIMRGMSQPTGTLVAPPVNGWTESLHKRLPYDADAARRLLDQAGYAQGFEVDFACPNNRYANDEDLCQAISAMWARVGVKARLRTLPAAAYFPLIHRYEPSIYMLGWSVPTFDAFYALQSLVRTVGQGGDGNYNGGRYSHPRMDYLVDRIKQETDLPVRNRMLTEALQLSGDTVSHIPLHNQLIPWAMKKNIELVHRADNRIDWRGLVVN